MSDSYADILNQAWDEIPEPVVLPVGSWLLKGLNASYRPPKDEGKNPHILFVYEVKEPLNDVSDAELAELGDNYDFASNRVFYRMWIENANDFNSIKRHLAKHGVDTEGKTVGDSLKGFSGTEVVAYLTQRQFTTAAGDVVEENSATEFATAA